MSLEESNSGFGTPRNSKKFLLRNGPLPTPVSRPLPAIPQEANESKNYIPNQPTQHDTACETKKQSNRRAMSVQFTDNEKDRNNSKKVPRHQRLKSCRNVDEFRISVTSSSSKSSNDSSQTRRIWVRKQSIDTGQRFDSRPRALSMESFTEKQAKITELQKSRVQKELELALGSKDRSYNILAKIETPVELKLLTANTPLKKIKMMNLPQKPLPEPLDFEKTVDLTFKAILKVIPTEVETKVTDEEILKELSSVTILSSGEDTEDVLREDNFVSHENGNLFISPEVEPASSSKNCMDSGSQSSPSFKRESFHLHKARSRNYFDSSVDDCRRPRAQARVTLFGIPKDSNGVPQNMKPSYISQVQKVQSGKFLKGSVVDTKLQNQVAMLPSVGESQTESFSDMNSSDNIQSMRSSTVKNIHKLTKRGLSAGETKLKSVFVKSKTKEYEDTEPLIKKIIDLFFNRQTSSTLTNTEDQNFTVSKSPGTGSSYHTAKFYFNNRKCIVKNVCPHQFAHIRQLYNVEESELCSSICVEKLKGGVSAGKSGSFFFISPDKKFILKSLNSQEFDFLKEEFINEYVDHMTSNANSLLPRFFGCFKLQSRNSTHRFIIMNNVFNTPLELHQIFDLKGSTVNRRATKKEKAQKGCIYKDLDVIEMERSMWLDNNLRLILCLQLTEDAKFLAQMKVMDYSFLLGIAQMDTSNQNLLRSSLKDVSDNVDINEVNEKLVSRSIFQGDFGGILARTADGEPLEELYFVGIIDVLQQYTWQKEFETIVKSTRYERDKLSSVDAERYSNRFIQFILKEAVH